MEIKKLSMTAVFTSLLVMLALPNAVFAQGYHVTGNVYVTNSTTGTSYVSGAFSNRWNTTASTTTTYIYANGYGNSSVTFYGRDGDGETFSCYVAPASALYAAAVDIKNSLTDGGYLYAAKAPGSSACTSVYLLNASYWLH